MSTSDEAGDYGVSFMAVEACQMNLLEMNCDNYLGGKFVIDGGNVKFTKTTSVRKGTHLQLKNASTVIFEAPGEQGISGAPLRLTAMENSSLYANATFNTSVGTSDYLFDNSVYSVNAVTYNHWLTLRNRSLVTGSLPMHLGNVTQQPRIISDGSGPNIIKKGLILVTDGIKPHNQDSFLTIDTQAELRIDGEISDFQDDWIDRTGLPIVKRGPATLDLAAHNTCTGMITLVEGTLKLSVDQAVNGGVAQSALRFLGGTIDGGDRVNAFGELTLEGDAAISLGKGSLQFAPSAGQVWNETAVLDIRHDGKRLPPRALRFGTDASALTVEQQRQIHFAGRGIQLDRKGYACEIPLGTFLLLR